VKPEAVGWITIILVLIFLIAVSPFITIWTLNTLFDLGIEFTVWTWLAAAYVNTMISYAGSGNRSKK
jgi:hypothetical protein